MAKEKTPATRRRSKTASHPPYFHMIKEALMGLKEKKGSSLYAIAKQIEEKHKYVLPENFRKTLSLRLKNSVSKGKLLKIRASYKLSETAPRETRQQSKKKIEERQTKTRSKKTKEALMGLKEKNGSSLYAIAKQIEEKHKSVLPENFRKTLSLRLKNSFSKGKLLKTRASYKLSETAPRETRQQSKKKIERQTKTLSKKTISLSKPEVATKKKKKVKKPRQPKSIKSPGSKKVLKASAT